MGHMIPHFAQVDAGLWRGGRPEPADYSDVYGKFRTVLSLEGAEEDIKEADGLYPMPVISFPIGFLQIYMVGISQTYLKTILTAIETAQKPIFVHCEHGQDRTGLVIAAWRARHGWSKDHAMQEARAFGYRYYLNFGLNRTWKDFAP